MNLHRRHLTQAQKAFVALKVEPLFAEEAKKRQGARSDIKEIFPESEPQARDQAGQLLGVSGRYVSDAKRIAKATVGVRAKSGYEQEARERQRMGGGDKRSSSYQKPVPQNFEEPKNGEAAEFAAKSVGTNRSSGTG